MERPDRVSDMFVQHLCGKKNKEQNVAWSPLGTQNGVFGKLLQKLKRIFRLLLFV